MVIWSISSFSTFRNSANNVGFAAVTKRIPHQCSVRTTMSSYFVCSLPISEQEDTAKIRIKAKNVGLEMNITKKNIHDK